MFTSRTQRGFTLIELLVVIIIIGLLTAVATTSYINAQKVARDNSRKTNVASTSTAVEAFYQAKRRFPGVIGNEGAGKVPILADRAKWSGCLFLDTDGGKSSVGYYSYPSSLAKCNERNGRVAFAGFTPADFDPYPSWIPELGEYLNPVPVEGRYQNASGSSSATLDAADGAFTPNGFDILGDNAAQALVYRHLVGGYMVYTRLEASTTDVQVGTAYTDSPLYGTSSGVGTVPVTVYKNNVFLIRK